MKFFRNIFHKQLLLYLFKFAISFCLCYFGTLAIIGLSAPGKLYSDFIHQYLNYVSWIRSSLLYGSKWLLSVFNFETYIVYPYFLKMKGGHGIRMVYSCVGYGVMSFWIALVVANRGNILKKKKWIVAGLTCIWIINVIRVSLLLVAINKRWSKLLGWDHHTWFNIVAYISIFLLIYFYDRSFKEYKPNQKILIIPKGHPPFKIYK